MEVLVAREAANGASMPLHEVRVSVATLRALGVACYEPRLLFAGRVICFASVEAQIDDGDVCMPTWMLAELELADGDTVSVTIDHPYSTDAAPARKVLLEVLCGARGQEWDDAGSESGDDSEDEAEYSPSRESPLVALREASGDAAVTTALRRQLLGHPARVGSIVAVQCLQGTAVLRLLEISTLDRAGAEAPTAAPEQIGDTTELELVCPAVASVGVGVAAVGALEGAEALHASLLAHARRLLLPAAATASSGGMSAAREATRGGHVLIYGPPANGKRHAMRRLAEAMRVEAGASVFRVSCARLLGSHHAGEPLDASLTAIFERARACNGPSLLLLDAMQLLCSSEQDEPSADAARVAMALVTCLRSTGASTLMLGSVVDLARLPRCLRSHGGFETSFPLPPPTAPQREAFLAAVLPPDLLGDATSQVEPATLPHSLAARTGGYTTGDLLQLLKVASAFAADGTCTSSASSATTSAAGSRCSANVKSHHLERALRLVRCPRRPERTRAHSSGCHPPLITHHSSRMPPITHHARTPADATPPPPLPHSPSAILFSATKAAPLAFKPSGYAFGARRERAPPAPGRRLSRQRLRRHPSATAEARHVAQRPRHTLHTLHTLHASCGPTPQATVRS